MAITKPTLTPAAPGQPVTAQAWNEFASGLSTLYDEVIALGGATLEVSVVFGGVPVGGAEIVAEPVGEGRPARAIPPFASRTSYLLVGLTTGNWRVHVRAAGFGTEVREVTLPREEQLVVELTRAGVALPDVFGLGLRAAKAKFAEVGLELDLVFDTTGRELPRASIPPEYDGSPVLAQDPERGEVVDPVTTRVRLLVASALRRDPVVTMPSLIGLTFDEAKQVLERLGLRVGETTIRSST